MRRGDQVGDPTRVNQSRTKGKQLAFYMHLLVGQDLECSLQNLVDRLPRSVRVLRKNSVSLCTNVRIDICTPYPLAAGGSRLAALQSP